MEQDDDDTHLCLRCNQTIIGLDNYVTHRQQRCSKITQAVSSPLLSHGSDILTSVDASAKELQEQSFTASDNYKLSAEDFFLSLNLQRSLNSVSDNFCSKLEFTSLENDLDATFAYDKDILPETLSDGSCMNIDGSYEYRWPSDKLCTETSNEFQSGENVLCDVTDVANSKSNSEISIVQCCPLASDESNKQYESSSPEIGFSCKQRVSKRKANSNIDCCTLEEKQLVCSLCNFNCNFIPNFLNHLLLCDHKELNEDKWLREVFRNEHYFMKNALFTCDLCSFYSNDRIIFLEHLKGKMHRQSSAKLQNPLLCLPCGDEYFSSDDIINHFSKTHLTLKEILHPVIVIEKKRNIHCCYCLALVKFSILSFSNNENNSSDNVDLFLSTEMKSVIHCAYGIEKDLLNSYFKLCKSFYTQNNSKAFDENLYSSDSDKHMEIEKVSPKENFIKKLKHLKTKSNFKKKLKPKLQVYFCFKCKTNYKNEVLFKNHLKSHNESDIDETIVPKKVYLCETCGFVCKNYHGMTKHRRYHTGERPFKCSYCDLAFAVSSSVLRHERTHTGLKPYSCPYCSYRCNTQENLRKHILDTKKHAGKKVYPCKSCSFDSNEFSDYQNHLLTIHSKTCTDFQNIH